MKVVSILLLLATSRFDMVTSQSERILRIGIQASSQSLVDSTYSQIFASKFRSLNYTVNSTALVNDAAVYTAIEQNTFDVFYGGPTIFNCLQSQYGLRGIAAAIDVENSEETPYLGAEMVARQTTGIMNISQISGTRVALTQLTHTVGCLAQWGEMRRNGLDLFVDTKAVILANTSASVLQAVASGVADVGFIRSGTVEQQVEAGIFTENEFNVVHRLNESFPWPVSTPLYPTVLMAVTKKVDDETATLLADALFEVDDISLPANISRWVPLQNYVPLQSLQLILGVMYADLSQCYRVSSYYDSIVCPVGYSKTDKNRLESSCDGILQCASDLYTCICGPCVKVPTQKAGKTWLVVVASLLPLPILLWGVYLCVQRRRHHVESLKLADLHLELQIARKNKYGDIWSGDYKGAHIEVKSVIPFHDEKRSGIWSLTTCQGYGVYLLGKQTQTESKLKRVQDVAQLRHPCVVQGIGPVVKAGEVMLVSLASSNGNLRDLLHNPTVEVERGMMMTMLYDIARGLEYLQSQNYKIQNQDFGAESIDLDGEFRAIVQLDSIVKSAKDDSHTFAFGRLMYDMFYRRQRLLSTSEPGVINFRSYDTNKHQDESTVTNLLQDCLSEDVAAQPSMKTICSILQKQSDLMFRNTINPLKVRNILRQMLPIDVIDEIKQNRLPAQRNYENVSICVIDISHRSLNISSVAELREIDSSLRSICETLSTKMCLMTLRPLSEDTRFIAIGNLMSPLYNHASVIIDFALEAIRKISRIAMRNNEGFLKVQAGIHVGKVKSCILGMEEARYSLLGRDMVTASELQMKSEPDHILVSKNAANQALLVKRNPPFNFFTSTFGRNSAAVKEFESVWLCAVGSQSQLSGSRDVFRRHNI